MQAAPGHIIADWNIIQACGIFAMSVSGHSSLPVLRNSMAQPQVCPLHLLLSMISICLSVPFCQALTRTQTRHNVLRTQALVAWPLAAALMLSLDKHLGLCLPEQCN